MFYQKQTLNCRGRLVSLEEPLVMGILNLTPDSFYDGGRYISADDLLRQGEKMLMEGATFIDVGGMSSRPGAALVEENEERKRVLPAIESLHRRFPEALISIDTVRAVVAAESVAAGACLVNDISAGGFDEQMYPTVARLGVPYVLMHMQGTPDTMQKEPVYEDVVREVLDFFIRETGKLRTLGVRDILLDPGFGFGKTVAHNYRLLTMMHTFSMLECPVLAGISRKSMICKILGVAPANALNGTTALHMVALQQGAKILRVHDVGEAREVIQLWQQTVAAEKTH
jgi:dihydropteroate synthase